MSDPVLTTQTMGDGVTLLTLNRPDKRNALNATLRNALSSSFGALADDENCSVVVVAGAGSTFCAGFDLEELQQAESPAELFAEADAYHRVVHTFPKPIVAAIGGPAVAGGMDLTLMCDVRIATQNATFGQPQVKFGVPAAYDLIRSVVAEPVAREICLTGRVFDAEEAVRIGLLHRLVEPPVVEAAVKVASSIAAAPASESMKREFVEYQPRLFQRHRSSDAV